MGETNNYQEILDAYRALQDSSGQLFDRELDEPIMIKSCVDGKPSYGIVSISDLWFAPYGSVLYTHNDEYMRVSTVSGWVCWNGNPVTHSEVYEKILEAAANGSLLAWMRPPRLSSRTTLRKDSTRE